MKTFDNIIRIVFPRDSEHTLMVLEEKMALIFFTQTVRYICILFGYRNKSRAHDNTKCFVFMFNMRFLLCYVSKILNNLLQKKTAENNKRNN